MGHHSPGPFKVENHSPSAANTKKQKYMGRAQRFNSNPKKKQLITNNLASSRQPQQNVPAPAATTATDSSWQLNKDLEIDLKPNNGKNQKSSTP